MITKNSVQELMEEYMTRDDFDSVGMTLMEVDSDNSIHVRLRSVQREMYYVFRVSKNCERLVELLKEETINFFKQPRVKFIFPKK